MPDARSPRDMLAEIMAGARQVMVPHLAEMLRTDRVKNVPPNEERARFWQRALTPEQEQQMWVDEAIARGITAWVPGSAEALDAGLKISKAVFPGRWDMAGQEGRSTEAQQAEWAWKHAKQGAPEPKQEGI